jgi:ParB family transcriptional regulator, chromosome partitioning protein
MSKDSKEAYGSEGKTNLLLFDPDKIKLVTDKKHPLYDPRVEFEPDESLIRSIMFKGVVEPVIVWKDPETGDVCAVDGRQRVKANREANKRLKKQGEKPKLIKAVVQRGDHKSLMGVMVMANEGRTDVTPLGRAAMARRLLEAGYNEDELATILHCSATAAKNYLALLDCSAPVRNAIQAGQIPATQAYKISRLDVAEQKKTVEKMIAVGKTANGAHDRSRKQRDVADNAAGASGAKRMRTRTEIITMREALSENDDLETRTWLDALNWALGENDSYPSRRPVKREAMSAE